MAQNPMESTTRDFWKMVKERECTVVVMLCSLEENGQVSQYINTFTHTSKNKSNFIVSQEVCHQYWPKIAGKQHYGDLLVEKTQENKYDGYTERVLSITDKVGRFVLQYIMGSR